MLFRLLTTVSLLIVVIALNENTQYFTPNLYTPDGEVLAGNYTGESLFVSEVVDGDTVKLSTGETVRYIGIDTPETKDPRKEIECFGRESSSLNTQLVKGKQVRLEKDVSDTDRYGRLLRYVYVKRDGEEIMVNKYLVENGYAKAATYPPDVKYSETFRQAEESAMFSNLGLWAECY